jgi:hypothetical protein
MRIPMPVRAATDLVACLGMAALAVAAVAVGMRWSRPGPDAAALAQPVRPPVAGEYRGPTVPQVMEEMRRRGDPNPPDVLEPEL